MRLSVITRRRLLLATRGQRRDEGHVLAGGAELCCAAGGTQVIEEVCVGADVFAPLFGDVVFVVDCFYGADGLAGAAVHALIGVDVQGAFTFVDAVDGAFFNACAVFDIHAGKRDYVGHWCAFLEAVRPVPAVLRVVCCRAKSTE